MMRQEDVLRLFESVGAIRRGHFELTSGLHSDSYVQCAQVLQYPRYAEALGRALAAEFHDLRIDCVISPAVGGIVLGQEVARALCITPDLPGIRAVFAERDMQGAMTLRRGFEIQHGECVLVVEDVWTTGGSTFETMRVVEAPGGRVMGGGRIEFPVAAEALLELKLESYEPEECPLCRQGSPAVRPGSRLLRSSP
jgi:orotate phosphoribosyltransferase